MPKLIVDRYRQCPRTGTSSRSRRPAIVLAIAALAGLGSQVGYAQTWDGGSFFSDDWSTAANWNPNAVPANNGTAQINMSGTTKLTPFVDIPWDIFTLNFDVLAGPFVIGGNQLTIRGGMFTADADAQTFNNNIFANGSQVWIASGGPLVFNGNIQANGTDTLSIAGERDTTFNGTLTNASGAFSLGVVGTGTVILRGASANTHGTTTVNDGMLVLQKDAAGIVAAPGNVTVGDGSGIDRLLILQSEQIGNTAALTVASSGVVDLSASTETIGGLIMTGGVVGGGGTLVLNGNVTTHASASTATIATGLNLGGAARTFMVADGAAVNDLTISGPINGIGGLTKLGAGTLAPIGANSFQGTVNINGGVLRIAHDAFLGNGTNGVVINGGTLLITNDIITSRPFTIGAAGGTITADAMLGLSTALTANSNPLVSNGTGTLVLNAASARTGSTTIMNGAVRLGSHGALGSGPISISNGLLEMHTRLFGSTQMSNVELLDNAGLLALGDGQGGSVEFTGSVAVHGSSATLAAQATSTLTIGDAANDFIGDAESTTAVVGDGSVSLPFANPSYAGDWLVSGRLRAGHAQSLGTGAITVSPGPGATLELAGAGTYNNAITLGGALSYTNTLTSGALANDLVLSSPATVNVAAAAVTFSIDGSITNGESGHGLTKTGPGQLHVNGPAFSVPVTVDAGVLRITAALAGTAPAVVQNGATLWLQGSGETNRPLVLNGAGASGLGALRTHEASNQQWSGAVSLAGNSTAVAGGDLTISGPLSGGFTLTKGGSAALTLTSASNSYGGLNVTEGAVNVTSAYLPATTVGAAGSLNLSATGTFNQPLTLNDGSLSVHVNSGVTTLSSNISGSGGRLIKTGSGELVLSGGNAQSNTFVNEGVLTAYSPAGSLGNIADVAEGAMLQLRFTDVIPSIVMAAGSGPTGLGGVFNAEGNNTLGFGLTLNGSATETTVGVAAGSQLMIFGPLTGVPLIKTGAGTLRLEYASNSYSGTTVRAGTLSVGADSSLGSTFPPEVTVANGATLLFTASTTTGRTFNLNGGTIQVASGNFTQPLTLTYDNATVVGGFLSGPDTHAVAGTSTRFTGVSAPSGTILIPGGAALHLDGTSLNLQGAVAVNHGTIAGGTVNVASGSMLAGTGSFGSFVLHPGGTFTPGASLSNMPAPAPAGTAAITSLDPNQSSASPIQLAAHTTATVCASHNLLTLAGPINGPGVTLTKVGGGMLALAGLRAGGLHVAGGVVNVLPNGGPGGLLQVGAMAVDGGAALRMNDNDLLVDYDGASIENAIRQLVRDGRTIGTGITTLATGANDTVLAIADTAEFNRTVWLGQTIDATTIIGKYTFFGDANLDGMVTGDDYLAVDTNLGVGDDWIEGDFNMDNAVTGDDYLAIDTNLGKGTSNPLAFAELKAEMVARHVAMFGAEYLAKLADFEANGFAVVPEPGALSLVGIGALGLLGRPPRR